MECITERLKIRNIDTYDWEAIKNIWDDQKKSKYARFDIEKDTNPEIVKRRISKWATCIDSKEHMFFAICLNDIVIGFVSFNIRENDYEIGFGFLNKYQRKGYAKESISKLIEYIKGFGIKDTIIARTALENVPSVNLLSSLGFKKIGSEKVSFYKDEEGNDIYFDGGIFEFK